MNFEKIFERATIRGVADYLLFGVGPDKDNRSYEERLDDLYIKFEKAAKNMIIVRPLNYSIYRMNYPVRQQASMQR